MDEQLRAKLDFKLAEYRTWSGGRLFDSYMLFYYSGVVLVDTMTLAASEVESKIEALVSDGYYVDWTDHEGGLYLRVWEFGSPVPAWSKVFTDLPFADKDMLTPDKLGEMKREFKPGKDNLIAGVILGLMMFSAGCFLIYLPVNGVIESGGNLPFTTQDVEGVKTGWGWCGVILVDFGGLLLVLAGSFFILLMVSLFPLRLRVYEHGLVTSQKSTERIIIWDEIVSVQETHLYKRPVLLQGIAGFLMSRWKSQCFHLRFRQGEPINFSGDTFKEHFDLAGLIKEETDRRGIPWEIVEERS